MTKKEFKQIWKFDYNKLLAEGSRNYKTSKNDKVTFSLSMTPDNVTCKNAKKADCIKTCIVNSGNAIRYARINRGRNNRKKLFYQAPDLFMTCLIDNIRLALIKHPEGIAIRLNMFSDIQYENIYYKGKNIYQWFKHDNVQFYDYTKIVDRYYNLKKMNLLSKVHLTFSYSPALSYYKELQKALKTDMNIAFIYNGSIPDTFLDRPVIDGDITDYRPSEGFKRLAIALKYKNVKDNSNMNEITI